MKTLTLSGIVKLKYDTWNKIKLVSEENTTLKVGGHNLYDEISSYEGKFILIELNFSVR